jgi:hypothetical protein
MVVTGTTFDITKMKFHEVWQHKELSKDLLNISNKQVTTFQHHLDRFVFGFSNVSFIHLLTVFLCLILYFLTLLIAGFFFLGFKWWGDVGSSFSTWKWSITQCTICHSHMATLNFNKHSVSVLSNPSNWKKLWVPSQFQTLSYSPFVIFDWLFVCFVWPSQRINNFLALSGIEFYGDLYETHTPNKTKPLNTKPK